MLNHCRVVFAFLILIGLISCSFSEETISPALPMPTNTSLPTIAQTETAVATDSPPTATPKIMPTETPLPTFTPTATVHAPSIEYLWEEQETGLYRLSGASDGYRHANYCDEGPFRWLTDTHLLLLPITGYTEWYEDPQGGQITQPAVLDVTTGEVWTTQQTPTDVCQLPVWSDALQALIETDDDTIFLRDVKGGIIAEYVGGNPLHLAPSGLRLLAGKAWIDLATNTMRKLSINQPDKIQRPTWTADETRFFDCCLRYGNTETNQFYDQYDMPGLFVTGIGVGPGYDGSPSRWLLDDQAVMSEGGAVFLNREDGEELSPLFVPLIDPEAFTFEDLGGTFGLTQTVDCQLGSYIRPAHNQIMFSNWNWEDCPAELTFVDLQTMTSETIAGYHFHQWSPNGRYALLFSEDAAWILEPDSMSITQAFEITEDIQLRDHAWSDDGEYLGFLSLGSSELINLYIIDLVNGETKTLPMSQPVTQIEWQPKQGGLSLLLLDNSIWYLPSGAETAVPLTDSIPSVSRDLQWSSDGTYLAFDSDTDLLVLDVSTANTKP